MRFFNAIVKVFLVSILLSVNSFADDFLKSESYTPGGEYRLFGSGRGSVSNIRGGFNESWQFGITAGNIAVNNLTYTGTVDYQQDFSGHGHEVHAPFSSSSSKFVENKSSSPDDGLKLSSVYVKGTEIHPADGYDGPQGGGYPEPTGARDEYHYDVTAHITTIKVVSLDKLNEVLPPDRKITERELKKLQNGEILSDQLYRELIITAENNKEFLQAQEITAKIPENCHRFCQIGDITEIPQSLVPQPETPVTADKHGFLYYLWETAKDFSPYGAYQELKEAEGFWDKSWALAGAIPPVKAVKKGQQVANAVDELNDARKVIKQDQKAVQKVSKQEQVKVNKAKGDAYEQEVLNNEIKPASQQTAQQITIKTDSGNKTKMDIMAKDNEGNIRCIECKSSKTAPLTKNQSKAFPEIEQSGGTIVGKGKPGFEGGTRIPPTKIEIFRPKE